MKKMTWILFLVVLAFPTICVAHFGMVIPSDTMIMQEDNQQGRDQVPVQQDWEKTLSLFCILCNQLKISVHNLFGIDHAF